jgi:hypothetical protein
MRPPPASSPPHSLARAPLLQQDALAHAGGDAGSYGSSDWDDTDEGTEQHVLFLEELRLLFSSYVSCVLPLLSTAASAAGETITAAWLGPDALLTYAGATLIQAPVTSIVGAMADACGMLSATAP